LDVQLAGETEFTLKVKSQNTIALAHADWVEAEATTVDGETIKIGTSDMACDTNVLPISFTYNGIDSEAWFNQWGIRHTHSDDGNFMTHRYVSIDGKTGLECTFELQAYKKFPAYLWNVYFRNTGREDTPILTHVNTLDLFWPASFQKMLYRAHGGFHYEKEPFNGEAFRDDFMLVKDNLDHTPEVSMGGVGGRSSVDWMPYFNFAGKDEGLIFGIGWTGQWHSTIKSNVDNVHFQAGMEKIHTVLKPGESIRQPSILMIYWQGDDPIRGHNLLRRFLSDEIMLHYDGKPVQTPLTYGSWGGMPTEEHLKRIANIQEQKLPYDYYWVDADWNGPDKEAGADTLDTNWTVNIGNWRINERIHPQGLKAISDAAHKAGLKFLLWVEAERAVYGTPITLEHPDWFLDELGQKEGAQGCSMLLNLGHPEAWKYCVELIAGLIEKQGLDCYRQDFNMNPLSY
jgi:alpha-galactosidase